MMSAASSRRVQAVGVTIPVRNEEQRLGPALEALTNSFAELSDSSIECCVALVLDTCRDESAPIAHGWKREVEFHSDVRVELLECDFANVGKARALGCGSILSEYRGLDPSSLWLATTDADSRVPRRWLGAQLDCHRAGSDAWVGRVVVSDWPRYRRETAVRWQHDYEREHRPVHGANLGFVAERYLAVRGFRPLANGEDRALVKALLESGAAVHFDDTTRVATSARRHARAPMGFASALELVETPIVEASALAQPSVTLDRQVAG